MDRAEATGLRRRGGRPWRAARAAGARGRPAPAARRWPPTRWRCRSSTRSALISAAPQPVSRAAGAGRRRPSSARSRTPRPRRRRPGRRAVARRRRPSRAAPSRAGAAAGRADRATARAAGADGRRPAHHAPPGLGDLDLARLRPRPRRRARNPPAARDERGQAAADIAQAIARQVQPCADRQVYPGPGAERIVTPIRLSLNRDGSLAGPAAGRPAARRRRRERPLRAAASPTSPSHASSPARRCAACPHELYDVPRGWSNFTMNYRLPG